jgi:enoyl-CoA hydratase
MGLANRVVKKGTSRAEAEALAEEIARFPQNCVRSDRLSAYQQFDLDFDQAMRNEFEVGLKTVQSGETVEGATRFAGGEGRHGSFEKD